MNKFHHTLAGLCLLSTATLTQAEMLAWDVSGEVSGLFTAVVHDPAADLLGVSRGTSNSVSFDLRIVVDTDSAPFIEHDTSVVKEYWYYDAIQSIRLDLNGTVFQSQRDPAPETSIQVVDHVSSSGVDQFNLQQATPNPDNGPLYNNHLVPFGQTIGGTLYENASINLNQISWLVSGTELLTDAALITDSGAFAAASGDVINFVLYVDFEGSAGLPLQLGAFSGVEVSVNPVPLPAAGLLLVPALALLGLVRRRQHG